MYEKFSREDSFVMIGMHSPEFAYERDPGNVRTAVERYGIRYPVALDSKNTTWKLYGNHYWPRQTIIDTEGRIRYEHIGEGDYEGMESRLAELLLEARTKDRTTASIQ